VYTSSSKISPEQDNYSYFFGGGISLDDDGILILDNCSMISNIASKGGGGVFVGNLADVTVHSLVCQKNVVTGHGSGGCLFVGDASKVIITDALMTENQADSGGAISAIGALSFLTNSQLRFNIARNGGAIFVDKAAAIYVVNSNLERNNATEYGGALYSRKSTHTTLREVSIIGNRAQFGGGVAIEDHPGEIENSTIWYDTENPIKILTLVEGIILQI
jgi:hypothetical protein